MIAVVGTIGIVLAFVIIGVLIDRKVPVLPRPEDVALIGKPAPPVHAPGTAPETALACTAAELEAHLAKRKCTCKGALARSGPDEPLRYDGRALIVVPLACAKCGARHRAYAALSG